MLVNEHTSTLAWTVRSHLLCIIIEDIAGVRVARNAKRAKGARSDFLAPAKSSTTLNDDEFQPPRLAYVRDLLLLRPQSAEINEDGDLNSSTDLGNASDHDVRAVSASTALDIAKMSSLKLSLLGLMNWHKSAYLDLLTAHSDGSALAHGNNDVSAQLNLDDAWERKVGLAFGTVDANGRSDVEARVVIQLMRSLVRRQGEQH